MWPNLETLPLPIGDKKFELFIKFDGNPNGRGKVFINNSLGLTFLSFEV